MIDMERPVLILKSASVLRTSKFLSESNTSNFPSSLWNNFHVEVKIQWINFNLGNCFADIESRLSKLREH